MTRTDRFANLAALRAEKFRLRAERDHHAALLKTHFEALKKGKVRSTLFKNTLSGLIGGSLPGKLLSNVIGNGGIGSGFGMAMGMGKGGWMKRMGLFVLGMAAPKLLKKLESISINDIGHEFAVSWERWKEHVEERRKSRT